MVVISVGAASSRDYDDKQPFIVAGLRRAPLDRLGA